LELAVFSDRKPQIYYTLSRIYLIEGNKEKAIEFLEKAFRIDPNFRPVYILLGELYRQSGMYKDAERVYKEVLEHSPNNLEVLNRQV